MGTKVSIWPVVYLQIYECMQKILILNIYMGVYCLYRVIYFFDSNYHPEIQLFTYLIGYTLLIFPQTESLKTVKKINY